MSVIDSPFVVFATVLLLQWLAAYVGDVLRRKMRALRKEGERQDFDIIRTASLTLLGLIIGFTFAMAVSRYDQRKNSEEAEANAIGTAYLRSDLMTTDDAERVRDLLRKYCVQRISYYTARDERQIGPIGIETGKLQAELWGAVSRIAKAQQTPIMALVVSGVNDVFNARLYAGGLVEPHPLHGLDVDGSDCHSVQPANGIWRTSYDDIFVCSAADRLDVHVSGRRH